MSPGRRPIQGVHQKRPTSKCQVTSFWLNRREMVKLFKLWIIVRTKTKENKGIFPFLMPYSCETDKKWHFHGSNTIKSTISNHFESNALCYQKLRSSLHQGEPVSGPHHAMDCLSTTADRLVITEPEPHQRQRSPLQTQPCSTGHGWLG